MAVVCFSDRLDETIMIGGKGGEILIPDGGLEKLGALLSLLATGTLQ